MKNKDGKPSVKIESKHEKDEECLPKSKYDLHLMEWVDDQKEARDD